MGEWTVCNAHRESGEDVDGAGVREAADACNVSLGPEPTQITPNLDGHGTCARRVPLTSADAPSLRFA